MRTTYLVSRRPPRVAGQGRSRRVPPADDPPAVEAPADGWAVEVRPVDGDGFVDEEDWAEDDEPPAQDEDPVELLQQAHDRLRRTVALREVIESVVDGLANGTGSDVALLREDDEGGWHVVAGSGLRTLEVRPLAAMPPLVGRLHHDSPVLTVAETDTVRGELAGLPLSRHRSLLVLRHPAELVTVLGRPGPFEQEDVELATSLLSWALPHLERGWRTEALLLSLVDWFEAGAPSQR